MTGAGAKDIALRWDDILDVGQLDGADHCWCGHQRRITVVASSPAFSSLGAMLMSIWSTRRRDVKPATRTARDRHRPPRRPGQSQRL